MGIFRYKFAMNFLMNFMAQLGYVGIFVLGGYYVVTGKTEIGTVVAFVSGLPKIVDPWGAIVDWYRDLRVTQVKFRLIKDAAKFGGASNRNMSAFRDSTLSRAERSRLY
jgi:ABC-type multidrug transport system fused ATPase/permease subunit